jgi:hypothetical protein
LNSRWSGAAIEDGRRAAFFVFCLYLVVSVLNTLPLTLQFTTHIPGHGSDAYQYLWNLWLVRHSIETGSSPIATELAFWPDGAKLYVGTTAVLESLATLPVLMWGGPIPAYNLLAIVKPALDAFAAFALAQYLWGDRFAALLAGVAFGFCPYVAARGLIHPALVNVAFIAFAVLWLLRAVETGRKRHYFLFAIAVFINVAMLHYALYVAAFAALFALWQTVWLRRDGVALTLVWRRMAIAGGAALVLSAPLVAMVLSQAGRTMREPELARAYGADLLAYLVPSPLHPLFGPSVAEANRKLAKFDNLTEALVFPGYGVMLLALAAPFVRRARSPAVERRPFDVGVAFWVFVALFFGVLSLGLELRINGAFTGITLPYAWLNVLPFWRSQNAPSRWSILAQLAMAMLAAATVCGLRQWRARQPQGRATFVLVLAVLAVSAEAAWAPYRTSPVPPPSPFYEQMARDGERYAVLDVPYGAAREQAVLAQMTHGKPTIGGYLLPPVDYLPSEMLPPFYDLDLNWPVFDPDVVRFDPSTDAAPVLRAFGVRYVLIHPNIRGGVYRTSTARVIAKSGLGDPVYRDAELVVYRVPDVELRGPVVVTTRFSLPDGRPPRLEPPALSGSGLPYREIVGGAASYGIWASDETAGELCLTAWNPGGETELRAEVNGIALVAFSLGREPRSTARAIPLRKGANRLTLRGSAAISQVQVRPASAPRP